MISQVVPFASMGVGSLADPRFWAEQGWKGALITVLLVAVLFSLYKGKIGIASFGPSEAGMREFLGIKLYRIGPGPHLDIEGFWKARKTSVAIQQVDLAGEIAVGGYTKQYTAAVHIHVQDSKQALIAHMYRAQDLNRENMENSEALKQATAILKRNFRMILEQGLAPVYAEEQLEAVCHKELREKYGYEIDQVLITELTDRPMSELARAVAESGRFEDATLSAAADQGPPHLEAIEGGIGAS